MYWEFEDGLTNTIAGATESALGANGSAVAPWKFTLGDRVFAA